MTRSRAKALGTTRKLYLVICSINDAEQVVASATALPPICQHANAELAPPPYSGCSDDRGCSHS